VPEPGDVPIVALLTRKPLVLKPSATVREAIELMASENVGSVVVVDDDMRPIGIFTERDLLMKVCARGLDPGEVRIEEVMTRDPIVVRESDTARKALEIMLHFGFRHLPVVDSEGRLVGVVSIRDVSQPLAGDVDVDELHAAG